MLSASMTYTVSDLLAAYEREYLPTKAPTTQYQQRQLFAWLRRELGYMLLTDLTPAFLRQWRDILSKRYAPGTVRRYLHSLSGPLSIAVRDYEWLPSNPLRKVQHPPESPSRVRFLSDWERVALLRASQVSRNGHLYAMILLALSTGARKEQVRQVCWGDIDLGQGTVRYAASKTTPRRVLPLLGPVLPLFRERARGQRPEAWVFARPDGLRPTLMDAAFRLAVTRGGIADFHFHDLRHSTASYLAMSGASPREIQEVLGHKTMHMSMRYTHLTPGHTAGVLGKMIDQFLAGILLASTLTTLASVYLIWG